MSYTDEARPQWTSPIVFVEPYKSDSDREAPRLQIRLRDYEEFQSGWGPSDIEFNLYDWRRVRKLISELPGYERKYPREADAFDEYLTIPKRVELAKLFRYEMDRMGLAKRIGWSRAVTQWIKEHEGERKQISDIHKKERGELPVLAATNRKLYRALHIGPLGKGMGVRERSRRFKHDPPSFQMLDVEFLAKCPHPLNGNQPGLGKTIETIGAVLESQTPGPWLVVAPVTSVNRVWSAELEHWQEHDFYVATGHRGERQFVLDELKARYDDPEQDNDFWLICNPDMIRYKGVYDIDGFTGEKRRVGVESRYPEFHEIEWGAVIVDEFHKMGLTNTSTLAHLAFRHLKAQKRMALSGTPMGGRPIRLYGILNWLEPTIFTNKAQFGQAYLEIENRGSPMEDFRTAVYGGVREDRQDAFDELMARYMVRHRKAEVAPWLPEKLYVHHECEMTPDQAAQYHTFRDEAEIIIEEFSLGAVGILAEYTRLKQFADAKQMIEKVGVKVDEMTGMTRDDLKLTALPESGKLKELKEILVELGLEKDTPYRDRNEQIIIFSQFTDVCTMLTTWLRKEMGLRVGIITGDVALKDRDYYQDRFSARELDAMVMNTKAGGVSINLETADTVVFFDETWDPDDQEQAEDRAHRTTKTSRVTVHYLRSVGTLEYYIWERTKDKSKQNWNVLDARRQGFRA